MNMVQLLTFSYLSTILGIALVAFDLRSRGLRTLAAVKSQAARIAGVYVMLGATAVWLGLMSALFAGVLALRDDPAMLLAAVPVYAAFFWSCRSLSV